MGIPFLTTRHFERKNPKFVFLSLHRISFELLFHCTKTVKCGLNYKMLWKKMQDLPHNPRMATQDSSHHFQRFQINDRWSEFWGPSFVLRTMLHLLSSKRRKKEKHQDFWRKNIHFHTTTYYIYIYKNRGCAFISLFFFSRNNLEICIFYFRFPTD